jgi:hypothetical protein
MIDLDLLIPDARPSTLPDRAPRCLEQDLLPPTPLWVAEEWEVAGKKQRRSMEAALIPDRDLRRLAERYLSGQATSHMLAAEWQVGSQSLIKEIIRRLGITKAEIKNAQARRHISCTKRVRLR